MSGPDPQARTADEAGPDIVPALAGRTAYDPGPAPARIRLQLDRNEGPPPPLAAQVAMATLDPEALRRYPSAAPVERRIAERHGLDPGSVLLCNGGDEGIDRCCRLMLAPGRRAVVHDPTFEMIERSAELAGAQVTRVPWTDGPFPRRSIIEAAEGDRPVRLIAIVTPNNPTGLVATVEDALAVADAAPRALVLVDAAYVEFHDEAFADAILAAGRPNIIVVRTFSKAWGLAGLRCGWLAGPPPLIAALRAAGGPYAVNGGTLATIGLLLDNGVEPDATYLARVSAERTVLMDLFRRFGATVPDSRANFVAVRFDDPDDALGVADTLAGEGIAVRRFADPWTGMLRITCPGNRQDFAVLLAVLCPRLGLSLPDERVDIVGVEPGPKALLGHPVGGPASSSTAEPRP